MKPTLLGRIAAALEKLAEAWTKPQIDPLAKYAPAILEVARRNVALQEENTKRIAAQFDTVTAPTQYPYACPVCRGQGKVSRPPTGPGDVLTWAGGTAGEVYACTACGGGGIVWSPTEDRKR